MGIIFCIMFGLIGGWISNSINIGKLPGGVKTLLFIGVAGGLAAAFIGSIAGWGIKGFNLFSVLLSIGISAVFVFTCHKVNALLNPIPVQDEVSED